ncbi:MAG: nucleoside monophosphate kinase, partial [Cyclobacteriaceae bacterium]|nr:nucleoside monophosphate kinase [Cyclobacteriaceae bacterium]
IDAGNLVPDSVVIGMVESKIRESGDVKGFIFDGFPRTEAQAVALDELMVKLNQKISGCVALEVADDELRARLTLRAKTSGRVDDQDPAKIENRIKVYYDETTPVIGFYKNQNKYYPIHGVGEIEEIFSSICQVVDTL